MMRFSPRRGVTLTWLAACLFVAAPIVDAQTTGYAIKDGVPCIDDVCMGDPLHKHIDRFSWLKARALSFGNKVSYIADAKPDAFALQMAAKTIKADEATRAVLARYLGGPNPAFDLPGLQALVRVQAVCGAQIQATATYVTADGNLSSVTFGVIPSADRQSQDIRVTRLGRKFVGNFTYEQKQQIKQHWQDAFAGAVFTSTNGKALYYVAEGAAAHDPKNQPGVGYSIAPNVGLGIRQPLAMNFANETMKHPLCASQLKLN